MRSTSTASPAPASRHLVVAPALGIPEAAGAAVLAAVRKRGPVARDVVAKLTALSIATVNRQVGALLDSGLVRERPDLAVSGAVGRPRVPVEINHQPFVTLGVHIGARSTSIVATDLLGRSLDAIETPTPQGGSAVALAALADTAQHYLRRWRRRRVLWVGVAVGGIVDSGAGTVTHPRLGWCSAPVGAVLAERLGLRVSVASHVDAMAAAELILGSSPSGRRFASPAATTTLYVYARETVGYALVIGGKVHTPGRGPGSIAGLPVRRDLLGEPATLEAAVSDDAVLRAARAMRIELPDPSVAAMVQTARAGHAAARTVLARRAGVLGEAIALLADLLNPDSVVVGGQAFTSYPEAMAEVANSFRRQVTVSGKDIRVTIFGDNVQAAGAGIVSLSVLYADPVSAMRRIGPAPAVSG
ncbi:MAG: ROK family protein [Actinomycetota bacterium]|nr:ROK family protein [Actinomycetota bacterium]